MQKQVEVRMHESQLEPVEKTEESACGGCCDKIMNNMVLTLTILGVFLGSISGMLLRHIAPLPPDVVMIISFPGEILMRMLKMLILPLVVSSLVTGGRGSNEGPPQGNGWFIYHTEMVTVEQQLS
ncbi:excitatory amino acid transporter 2-like [Gadus macrocephalus]|uniref:excitatory amino acid transporter 2-like n=1 Tax=Gadus macrocephalus TaxID=80720 RepID=UPI0028CB2C8E|nr:excitatory amino acid transporter 2-like [Gadus macrocephalus]